MSHVSQLKSFMHRALTYNAHQGVFSHFPSRIEMVVYSALAVLRWKIFRLISVVTMGKLGGCSYLGSGVIRDIGEKMANIAVRSRVESQIKIDGAYVQHYDFAASFPPFFRLKRAFGDCFVYLLSDVVIAPAHGTMWFSDGRLLQESVISIPHFYSFGGVFETLLPAVKLQSEAPLAPLSFHNCYYHQIFEGLLPALRVLHLFPNVKFLVPFSRPTYFDVMSRFFGIGTDRFIESSCPVCAKHGLLVTRRHESGYVRQADVDFLKFEIEKHIDSTNSGRKIYISRSKTGARRIKNEIDFENALSKLGFDICHFEVLPFDEQMKTIHSASIVIAPHGSGEANMIAARKGTKWIELLQEGWFELCYARLALQLGLNYSYFELESDGSNFSIPINTIVTALEKGE